jgi:hypothetical protein
MHHCTDNSRYDTPAAGRVYGTQPDEKERKFRSINEGWRASLIARKDDLRVILRGIEKAEYFGLFLDPEMLSGAMPIVYFKLISDRELVLSYFHVGIRSAIKRTVEFEMMTQEQYAAGEPLALRKTPFRPTR